jgi:predicted nucleic acid-binding protein
MRYLLDVNSLVALGFLQHEFHDRVAAWVRTVTSKGTSELATCSITELGFVRVLAQLPQYRVNVVQARQLLTLLKSAGPVKFVFVADDHDISHLPDWVKAASQTTDGHLAQLAKSKNAVLATLDRKIQRALIIP